MKPKFKKLESYYDVYIRDDGFLLKFNQSDIRLNDLLMFKGFTPENIGKVRNITIQINIGGFNSVGYTINGWLHWGDGSTTCASKSAWIFRDTVVDILKKRICWTSPLPKYNDYGGGVSLLIKYAVTMSTVHSKNKNNKNFIPHVFDMRTNKE